MAGTLIPTSQTTTSLLADSAVVFTAHTLDLANPHVVTATQVGLGNVDNTSDVNKPISTAQTSAFVALTGGQTVAGVKTFSSPVGVAAAVASGDAVQKAQSLGQATSATDVVASRSIGTAYQNTSGRMMVLMFSGSGASAGDFCLGQMGATSGTLFSAVYSEQAYAASGAVSLYMFIPSGWYYKIIQNVGTITKAIWVEI